MPSSLVMTLVHVEFEENVDPWVRLSVGSTAYTATAVVGRTWGCVLCDRASVKTSGGGADEMHNQRCEQLAPKEQKQPRTDSSSTASLQGCSALAAGRFLVSDFITETDSSTGDNSSTAVSYEYEYQF